MDPSGNSVGIAMCMYLNSDSLSKLLLLLFEPVKDVSDGNSCPFATQEYAILPFVGVNAYL